MWFHSINLTHIYGPLKLNYNFISKRLPEDSKCFFVCGMLPSDVETVVVLGCEDNTPLSLVYGTLKHNYPMNHHFRK